MIISGALCQPFAIIPPTVSNSQYLFHKGENLIIERCCTQTTQLKTGQLFLKHIKFGILCFMKYVLVFLDISVAKLGLLILKSMPEY